MGAFQYAVVFIGLLAMVQPSMQLSLRNPLHSVVDRVNVNQAPPAGYIALVLGSESNEQALNESNAFTPNSHIPHIDLSGRRFHIGKIDNADVIYVKSGGSTLNTAITVQLLLDLFHIRGIVQVGGAGAINDTLSVGDVSVPSKIAYIGNWKWENFYTRERKGPLQFGHYNLPESGLNYLQSIRFDPLDLYSSNEDGQTVFWLRPDDYYLEVASRLEGVKLEKCASNTNCISQNPQVVVGLRATSADIYVVNDAFREFVHRQFQSSTVDTDSAALAFTAITNGVSFISFRGVSNSASSSGSGNSYLGSVNAVNAAVKFIGYLPQPRVYDN